MVGLGMRGEGGSDLRKINRNRMLRAREERSSQAEKVKSENM